VRREPPRRRFQGREVPGQGPRIDTRQSIRRANGLSSRSPSRARCGAASLSPASTSPHSGEPSSSAYWLSRRAVPVERTAFPTPSSRRSAC
jgi:hypothetical protein